MVNVTVKKFFFDRAAVINAVGRARAQVMARAGAYVCTRARSLLRRRKKTSQPGSPPSIHAPSGDYASLKNILFGWDPATETVIVGPVGINRVDRLNGIVVNGAVPALHEFGGTASVHEYRTAAGHWRRVDGRKRWRANGKLQRVRVMHYPARPFMGPALEAEVAAGKIADVWSGALARRVA